MMEQRPPHATRRWCGDSQGPVIRALLHELSGNVIDAYQSPPAPYASAVATRITSSTTLVSDFACLASFSFPPSSNASIA
jgi:hypothetical protein